DIGEARFGRKRDQRDAFISAERIGLISPIEKMRVGPNGIITVFGGLMVGEEAFRFFVDAATFESGHYMGEQARHLHIPSNLTIHFNDSWPPAVRTSLHTGRRSRPASRVTPVRRLFHSQGRQFGPPFEL